MPLGEVFRCVEIKTRHCSVRQSCALTELRKIRFLTARPNSYPNELPAHCGSILQLRAFRNCCSYVSEFLTARLSLLSFVNTEDKPIVRFSLLARRACAQRVSHYVFPTRSVWFSCFVVAFPQCTLFGFSRCFEFLPLSISARFLSLTFFFVAVHDSTPRGYDRAPSSLS